MGDNCDFSGCCELLSCCCLGIGNTSPGAVYVTPAQREKKSQELGGNKEQTEQQTGDNSPLPSDGFRAPDPPLMLRL